MAKQPTSPALRACISARKPGTGGFRKVWYLPGLVYVLFALATLVNGLLPMFRNLGDFLFDAPSTVLGQYFLRGVLPILLMQLPSLILYTIAYLLAGKWIANPYKKGVQPPVPQPQFRPQYQPVIPQPQYQPPQAPAQAVSLADQELAFHRQRLNAGAITQEEFDTIEKNLKGE